MRIKASIAKDQLVELLKGTQPPNAEIVDIFVRLRDGEEKDFAKLVIDVNLKPAFIKP